MTRTRFRKSVVEVVFELATLTSAL